MLTAIPVRWLEDNRGWRVRTNLTASGSGVGSWTFNVQRSTFNAQRLPQQNAKNAEGGALAGQTLAHGAVLPDGILRHSAGRPSRNQNGARLWSKTQPQSVALGMTGVLRLVLRTQPRSGKLARHATIRTDTGRLQVCARKKSRNCAGARLARAGGIN